MFCPFMCYGARNKHDGKHSVVHVECMKTDCKFFISGACMFITLYYVHR
jgi:hypothetical protein